MWTRLFANPLFTSVDYEPMSSAHLRRPQTYYFVGGIGRGAYSRPFATRSQAEEHARAYGGAVLSVRAISLADARRRSDAAHQRYLALHGGY